ncbi:MAG: pyridoxal phosphate-dependent decarboxylase family protein [Nodosilinea sp.]
MVLPLPENAFIHPHGYNQQQIASLFKATADQILAYLTSAATHVPIPDLAPLPLVTIPEQSGDLAELLAPLQRIMAQSMNPAHPGYVGHMDPLPTTASLLGDWVAAALNNNMLSVEMSPALSRLEPQLMAEIAQMFGLGERSGGLLVSGGSLANLQALTVARNLKLNCLDQGLTGQAPPVILASEMAHTSIQKAAMVLGLGRNGVVPVAANARGQMDPEALQDCLEVCLGAGQRPFAVVATAGTTVTGSIDPLLEIHRLARTYDLWFHVDAAYGGALIFSPQHRYRLQGIDLADSVTFNPQKWLYVTKTCASVLFRDMTGLEEHFRISAPYMNRQDNWANLGEITLQGTRHGDILKLWLSLQHLGKAGYAALIETSYGLTRSMVDCISQRPHLTLACTPAMNLVCFRSCPASLPESQWDDWNSHLQQNLLAKGQVFFSLPWWRGERWLKAVLLNPYTTDNDINNWFALLDTLSERV